MAAVRESDLRGELLERRRRLETTIASTGEAERLVSLLEEVDAALRRMDEGTYGLCETCHDDVEPDRLRADPLRRYCLDHLTPAEQDALQQDLDLAARIQDEMLPRPDLRLDGWEAAFHYEPLGSVSGDYCDLVPPDAGNGDLFFVLGDVSGKGVAASMLMAALRATVRTLVGSGLPVSAMVERANRLFCESTLPSHFATLVCGRASRSGEVEVCNAGHLPPLLASGGRITSIEATGLPVGLFCNGEYRVKKLRMETGDALLLYTDGVSETRGPSRTEYGIPRLSGLLQERHALAPKALVATCLEDLAAFRSGAPRSDDLTLMALRRR